ncbi:MAG: glycosyltransferase family 2 protein [Nitrospirota bacterium]
MAGRGSRFAAAGYRAPKPLIDMFGKTMIETVIDNLRPRQPARFIFICQREHYREYGLEQTFQRSLGEAWGCVQLNGVTEGAACTVLAAQSLIEDDAELIVANSDQIVDCSMTDYIECARIYGVQGLVMTFPANDAKWSYIRLDSQGYGIEVAEKRVISPHATVGIYYFAAGKIYKDAARAMVAKNIRVNNEFYVAPVYNEIIRQGGKVRIWEIDATAMHGIGTPSDLDAYFALRGGYASRSAPVS